MTLVVLYLLLGREDDGQVSPFGPAVIVTARPAHCASGDEVTAVVEDTPVLGTDDGGSGPLGRRFHHHRS